MQIYKLYKHEVSIVETLINESLSIYEKFLLIIYIIINKKDLLKEEKKRVYLIRGETFNI